MSAGYQNLPAPMDFPVDFLEPCVSAPVQQQQSQVNNAYFSQQAGYTSTNNNSLSSSHNPIHDDPGLPSNSSTSFSTYSDTTSTLQFLDPTTPPVTLTTLTTLNDPLQNPTQMEYNDSFDAFDDLEPMVRDRCNTWPLKRPNMDPQINNSPPMHEIAEEEGVWSRNGSQASIHMDPYMINDQMGGSNYQQQQMGSREQMSSRQVQQGSNRQINNQQMTNQPHKMNHQQLNNQQMNNRQVQQVQQMTNRQINQNQQPQMNQMSRTQQMTSRQVQQGSNQQMNQNQQQPQISNQQQMNNRQINNQQPHQMNNQQQLANQMGSQEQDLNYDSPPLHYSDENSQDFADEDDYQDDGVQKKSQTRRNAWGNLSYSDLITRAIESSPDQRLTLSQVYEWMVENVPYFSDKGDTNSSAGWKNSIRHNLSLHSRFMRVQNEGTGKSSWWIINPEAKVPKNSRRRATMDISTKQALERKRRGARKLVELRMQGSTNSLANSRRPSHPYQPSNTSNTSTTNDQQPLENDSNYNSFRSRTFSNASVPDQTRISPTFSPNCDSGYQPWTTSETIQSPPPPRNTTAINDLSNQTDLICLDGEEEYSQQMVPAALLQQQQQSGYQTVEVVNPLFQQNANRELEVVCGISQQIQNSLLRSRLTQESQFQPEMNEQQRQQDEGYPFGCNRTKLIQQNSQPLSNQPTIQQPIQPSTQQSVQSPPTTTLNITGPQPQQVHPINPPPQPTTQQQSAQLNNDLFMDLESLEKMDTFLPSDCNLDEIERIIRDELLSTSSPRQFSF